MMEFFTILLLFGALLYRSIGVGLLSIGIISALTSAFFFIYFLSRKGFVIGIVVGCVIFLGAVTVWFHTTTIPRALFKQQRVVGIVQSVDRELDKTVVVIQENSFQQRIQVTVHAQTSVLPGDTASVQGVIERPTDFVTDTGRLFPYQDYMAAKGIIAVVNNGGVTIIKQGNFSLNRFATSMRFHIVDIFTEYVQFPVDGLLAGMLVGYQGGVPKTISDVFRTTGVLHVLVLSGENITLLAIFLGIMLRPLPFVVRTVLTGFAIILIVLISGAGLSAIRAGIMGSIALSAGLLRRSYVPLRALTVSVVCFFFISPQTIFTDPGFHLSVLATIFMIVVLPKIEPWFRFVSERFNIRELVILAVCVPLFMLPYTMYFSGLVPTTGPFANIVMAILTPFFMLAGASILAVAWCMPIAQLLGTIISLVGAIVLKLLEILNALPQLNTPPLAWWGVVASYILFFSIVFRFELRQFLYDWKSSFLPQTNSSVNKNP